MKKGIPCPIKIGEFNRLVKNLAICKKLTQEQHDWLEYYMDEHKHELKDVVLVLDEDNVLCLVINTHNSVRQFTR